MTSYINGSIIIISVGRPIKNQRGRKMSSFNSICKRIHEINPTFEVTEREFSKGQYCIVLNGEDDKWENILKAGQYEEGSCTHSLKRKRKRKQKTCLKLSIRNC